MFIFNMFITVRQVALYEGPPQPWRRSSRYATFEELLRETKGKSGWTPCQPKADLAAIEAYLMTW